ncbi:hypothetical protein ACEPPN_010401 [Leptodophora sp. 'Broadleaf-Isolate-01']
MPRLVHYKDYREIAPATKEKKTKEKHKAASVSTGLSATPPRQSPTPLGTWHVSNLQENERQEDESRRRIRLCKISLKIKQRAKVSNCVKRRDISRDTIRANGFLIASQRSLVHLLGLGEFALARVEETDVVDRGERRRVLYTTAQRVSRGNKAIEG